MKFSSSYFAIPKLLPSKTSPIYKSKMLSLTTKELMSYPIAKGLPHLYKRFLRLHSFIDIPSTSITEDRFVALYATMIRSKFKPIRTFAPGVDVEIVGDTDMFVKLKNIRALYESGRMKNNKLFNSNVQSLLKINYLHYSIEDFVNFYTMLLKDINENEGKFIKWFLTNNVSALEDYEETCTNKNSIVYGSLFYFNFKMYVKRTNDSLAWRNLVKTEFPCSAGMCNQNYPLIKKYSCDYNEHSHVAADFTPKDIKSFMEKKESFFSPRYHSLNALRPKLRQRALAMGFFPFTNLSPAFNALRSPLSQENLKSYSLLYDFLHESVNTSKTAMENKRYVTYNVFNFGTELLERDKDAVARLMKLANKPSKASKFEKYLNKKRKKLMNTSSEEHKAMLAFLEMSSENLDTMKYGVVTYSHHVLTTDYLMKKLIVPYVTQTQDASIKKDERR